MKVFRVVEKRGFDQAIDLSLEILSNVKFVQETRLIGKSWKKSFRIVESLCMAWRIDAMKGLGIWEDFIGYKSVCVEKHQDGWDYHKAFEQGARGRSEQLPGFNYFIDFEVQDEKFLLERFEDVYKPFGCSLETVTDNSEEDLIFVEDLVALEGSFAISWTLNHLINQKFVKTLSKRQDFHCFRHKTSKNLFSVMLNC